MTMQSPLSSNEPIPPQKIENHFNWICVSIVKPFANLNSFQQRKTHKLRKKIHERAFIRIKDLKKNNTYFHSKL